MFQQSLFWIKKIYKRIKKVFFTSSIAHNISDERTSIEIINDKIKLLTGNSKNSIDTIAYEKYFNFHKKLGLQKEFSITTTLNNLVLYGTIIYPILINSNNNKIIIFCHGLNNNRWSLFYTMHLALQRGYQIVSYDARNHGFSDKSSTTLGQNEACDLQDIIHHVKKNYCPEKIGLYGFSMGAATLLFWLSYFGRVENSKVVFAICESSFDNVSKQLKVTLGSGINYYWKEFFVGKLIREKLNSSYEELEKINPSLSLPQQLPIKLLLIHGLKDVVIDWRASFNLWYQLNKDELNKDKVNLYLCRYADHGEVPFIGDYVLNSLRWKTRRQSSWFTFSTLFFNYLQKNL